MTLAYKSVVLVKQVPDTTHITGKAMKDDGTVNRGALPAIFNPEDLNALEMALQVKDAYGGHVTVLTMGPPQAAEVLRDSLYRGADEVVLVTDRKVAGSDTLATSYVLKCAVETVGDDIDLVFCGRQAIDGDTAQVGPQVAEKLGLPQITYAEEILDLADGTITARRALPLGTETVRCRLPCLLTVVGSANNPRPPSAKRSMAYKMAATPLEYKALLAQWPEFADTDELDAYLAERGARIPVWRAEDIGAEEGRIGLAGSPTKVSKVDFVVLEPSGSTEFEGTPEGITSLIHELVEDYIL
ncbi:MAG: electron transfer flavoprotein subunit beta/FixA family protein [Anaerolineae bacterium]